MKVFFSTILLLFGKTMCFIFGVIKSNYCAYCSACRLYTSIRVSCSYTHTGTHPGEGVQAVHTQYLNITALLWGGTHLGVRARVQAVHIYICQLQLYTHSIALHYCGETRTRGRGLGCRLYTSTCVSCSYTHTVTLLWWRHAPGGGGEGAGSTHLHVSAVAIHTVYKHHCTTVGMHVAGRGVRVQLYTQYLMITEVQLG